MNDVTGGLTPNPLHRFPEYLTLSRRRLRHQTRLLGSAVLVGVVAVPPRAHHEDLERLAVVVCGDDVVAVPLKDERQPLTV
jgi:hypothetical protein